MNLTRFNPLELKYIYRAIEFALNAHREQKYGDHPYSYHLYGVFNLANERRAEAHELAAAMLHDVIEDTTISAEDLIDLGFSRKTVEIVEIVSRDKSEETYFYYIHRIRDSGNQAAINLKMDDLRFHLNQPFDPNLVSLKKKYKTCLKFLEEQT